jgi:hypothetical protein
MGRQPPTTKKPLTKKPPTKKHESTTGTTTNSPTSTVAPSQPNHRRVPRGGHPSSSSKLKDTRQPPRNPPPPSKTPARPLGWSATPPFSERKVVPSPLHVPTSTGGNSVGGETNYTFSTPIQTSNSDLPQTSTLSAPIQRKRNLSPTRRSLSPPHRATNSTVRPQKTSKLAPKQLPYNTFEKEASRLTKGIAGGRIRREYIISHRQMLSLLNCCAPDLVVTRELQFNSIQLINY